MVSVLDLPHEDVLAAVEAAAATGNRRAESLLATMLEEEATSGELSVFSRLAAGMYCDDLTQGGTDG
jgi:hypothetical protein